MHYIFCITSFCVANMPFQKGCLHRQCMYHENVPVFRYVNSNNRCNEIFAIAGGDPADVYHLLASSFI